MNHSRPEPRRSLVLSPSEQDAFDAWYVHTPQDINEFSRLFKIPIPKHGEFEYYVQTLANVPQYEDLLELVWKFVKFEKQLEGTLKAYKKKCFEAMVAYVRATQCYERILEYDAAKNLFRKKLTLQPNAPWLLSVDVVQANFNTFRCFDLDSEIGNTWEGFCQNWGTDPLLAESKSFRQFVFGHLSPGRVQRIQHEFITQFIKVLDGSFGTPWERKVFISPDEVILAARSIGELRDIMDTVRRVDAVRLENGLAGLTQRLPRDCFSLKLTPFQLHLIEGSQYRKVLLDPVTLKERETRLFGVPGNMYFMQFKQHVLQEPLDEKDLFFWTEHRLAKWVV